MINILFFGDISGKTGREALKKFIPELKKKYSLDFIIANGENASHGLGISEDSLKEILGAGVDFLTSGNHIFHRKEAISIFENINNPIIRPLNFVKSVPGKGYRIVSIYTWRIAIVNLLGQVFMNEQSNSPFEAIKEFLENYTINKKEVEKEWLNGIIVDFHAEATSEKRMMGFYLDGKVSAVLGTHSHVPTADLQRLPKGTVYISDVGMVGARNSILGLNPEGLLPSYVNQMPPKMEILEGEAEIGAVYLQLDPTTGIINKYEQIIQ